MICTNCNNEVEDIMFCDLCKEECGEAYCDDCNPSCNRFDNEQLIELKHK